VLLAAGWRGMKCFLRSTLERGAGDLPDYLGNHVRVSVTALALGLLVSLPLAILSRHRPIMRGALLGLPALCRRCPAWRYWRCSIRAAGAAALSLAWFGFGFPRLDSSPRCWRWRSIHAAGAAQHHHRPARRPSLRSGRPRKAVGHDGAAVVVHG